MPYRPSAAAVLAALLALSVPAQAGSFGVAPIRIELDRNAKTGLVTVTNDDDRKLYFQAKLMAWTQSPAGEDAYAESTDLVFFPQIFSIEPKQKRAIRIGTKAPQAAPEKAYRLFIEEMPDPSEGPAAGAQVAVRLRFGVPIFHWNGTPKPRVEASAAAGRGEAILTVHNTGERNVRFEEVLVTQGERVLARASGWYLFPGVRRSFAVPIPREACPISGALRVRAVGEGQDVSAPLDSAAGLCPA